MYGEREQIQQYHYPSLRDQVTLCVILAVGRDINEAGRSKLECTMFFLGEIQGAIRSKKFSNSGESFLGPREITNLTKDLRSRIGTLLKRYEKEPNGQLILDQEVLCICDEMRERFETLLGTSILEEYQKRFVFRFMQETNLTRERFVANFRHYFVTPLSATIARIQLSSRIRSSIYYYLSGSIEWLKILLEEEENRCVIREVVNVSKLSEWLSSLSGRLERLNDVDEVRTILEEISELVPTSLDDKDIEELKK